MVTGTILQLYVLCESALLKLIHYNADEMKLAFKFFAS